MNKRILTGLLVITSNLLAMRTPARLMVVIEEIDKAKAAITLNRSNPPIGIPVFNFQQAASPMLLNANLARVLLTNRLQKHEKLANVLNFNWKDWQFYSVNGDNPELTPLVLLIPISYANRTKETLGDSLGFNTAALKKYDSTEAGVVTLLKELGDDRPTKTAPYARSIEQVFDSTAQTTWTIYIVGHGCESLQSPEKTPITIMLRSTTSHVPFARIADISIMEFLKLTEFLARNLDVHLLLIESCAAPGYHANAIHQLLNITQNKTMAVATCGARSDESTIFGLTFYKNATRNYSNFFTESERAQTDSSEDIRNAIAYVCSDQEVLVRPAAPLAPDELTNVESNFTAMLTNPTLTPLSKKTVTIDSKPKDSYLRLTTNDVSTPIFIKTPFATLVFNTIDSSRYTFNSINLAEQNPLDFAINTLVTQIPFESDTREFRRLRGETAHPIVITAEKIIGKTPQAESARLFGSLMPPHETFEIGSVVAIRYPSQLPYDGELIFALQLPDGTYTLFQAIIGDDRLPPFITRTIAPITAVDLPYKIKDLHNQAMANEYLQELAAFGRIKEIYAILEARKHPKDLKLSREMLAFFEKRSLWPYTLPDERGIMLAFATAIAQGEMMAARMLFQKIKKDDKSLPFVLKALRDLWQTKETAMRGFPKNEAKLQTPEIYSDILAFLEHVIDNIKRM